MTFGEKVQALVTDLKKPDTGSKPADLKLRSKDDVPAKADMNFKDELPGWHGYIEWEKYPEKKAKARELLKKYDFPKVGLGPENTASGSLHR